MAQGRNKAQQVSTLKKGTPKRHVSLVTLPLFLRATLLKIGTLGVSARKSPGKRWVPDGPRMGLALWPFRRPCGTTEAPKLMGARALRAFSRASRRCHEPQADAGFACKMVGFSCNQEQR